MDLLVCPLSVWGTLPKGEGPSSQVKGALSWGLAHFARFMQNVPGAPGARGWPVTAKAEPPHTPGAQEGPMRGQNGKERANGSPPQRNLKATQAPIL